MKKIIYVILLTLTACIITQSTTPNSDYRTYEYLEMTRGKLLENFTEAEYKSYYEVVDQRKFMGWNIHKVYENVKVTYTTQTLFSYYNDGFSAIDYEYKLDRKQTSKLGLSATGTISTKTQKADKLFKNNLDASLKLSADYQQTSEEKEAITMKLKVDPGTQVDLYIYGEGRITNGVACRYVFFVRMDRGGFEVFLITTQYQRLEKKRI
jgi:hypothetical protein